MERSLNHHFSNPYLPADDHRFQFELYTIPATSNWFSWDTIHDIEKTSLHEFFNNTSFTRNPRVYKEYRDFIISKYREDPSRRLTFSEIRKSLVGDVSFLIKVFLFLEKWGLINFGAGSGDGDGEEWDGEGEEGGGWRVRVEEGAPSGVRVVAVPNSVRPVLLPPVAVGGGFDDGGRLGESEFKMGPLASHSDVYQDLIELVCGRCKELCESGHYEDTTDGSLIICTKCFENGAYGNNKSADDYKFIDHTSDNGTRAVAWTEGETLLLLESVLKHGDDWDLVAQNVQTKSKLDCISKLMQLPFGHLMLGPTRNNRRIDEQKQGHTGPGEIKEAGSQHMEIDSNCQYGKEPPAHEEIKETGSQHMELESNCQHEKDPPADEEIKETESQLLEIESNCQHENGPPAPEETKETESQLLEIESNCQHEKGPPAPEETKESESQHLEIESNCQHEKGPPAPEEAKESESQHMEIESNCQREKDPSAHEEPKETESQYLETETKWQQNGGADIEAPPAKRICIAPNSDSSNQKPEQTNTEYVKGTPLLVVTEEHKEKESQICELKKQKHIPNFGNSLMHQVAHISAAVGPHVAASAAEAVLTALCDENEVPKELFESEENGTELPLSTQVYNSERTAQGHCLEMDARPSKSENGLIPLSLRVRATCATALGAAAAHAKLLAVQEDREIEHLVSSIINTQLKKLQYKMELLNEAEGIMEKEYNQMTEVQDVLLTERMDVVQKVIDSGLSRWRDKTAVKSQEETVLQSTSSLD